MENPQSDKVVNTYITEETGRVINEYEDGHFNTGESPSVTSDGSLYHGSEKMILQEKGDK